MYAATFHSPEPGHLTLCELVYGHLQFLKQILIFQLPCHIQGNIFIFKSVIDKVIGRYPSLKEAFDLINHTLVYALLKAAAYELTPHVAAYVNTYVQAPEFRERPHLDRSVTVALLNLDGTDGTLAGVDIGSVMQRLVSLEYLSQFGTAGSQERV